MVNLNKWTASTDIIWHYIDRYTAHNFPWCVGNDGKWAESVISWPESATICDTKCVLTGRTNPHHVMVLPPIHSMWWYCHISTPCDGTPTGDGAVTINHAHSVWSKAVQIIFYRNTHLLYLLELLLTLHVPLCPLLILVCIMVYTMVLIYTQIPDMGGGGIKIWSTINVMLFVILSFNVDFMLPTGKPNKTKNNFWKCYNILCAFWIFC